MDEIKKQFQEGEIVSLRAALKNLETQWQMKQVAEKVYIKTKMDTILSIKSLNAELTEEEKVFISTDNQFKDKESFEMNKKTEEEYLGTAQKEISDKLKQ